MMEELNEVIVEFGHRTHREVYVRFGGEYLQTYHSNVATGGKYLAYENRNKVLYQPYVREHLQKDKTSGAKLFSHTCHCKINFL